MTLWLKAREWLLPALKPDDGGESGLLADLASGKAQLWVGEGAAMVTQCLTEGSRRVVHAWLAGGSLVEILAMTPGMEAWARAWGCTHATVKGRKGWAKALRAQGYAPEGDELVKAL